VLDSQQCAQVGCHIVMAGKVYKSLKRGNCCQIQLICCPFPVEEILGHFCKFIKWVGGWMDGRGQFVMTHKHSHGEEVCQVPAEAKVTRKQAARVT